jgi:hypothetical protein
MAHAEQGLDIEEGIGPQEIDAGPVSIVVVFGAVTTVILILLTILFYKFMVNTILETKGLDEPNVKVAAVIAEQRKDLASGGVVDAQKKLIKVPIETAMAMIVEQRTKDPNPKLAPVAPQAAKPASPAENKDAAKSAPKAESSKDAVDKAKAAESTGKETPKKDAAPPKDAAKENKGASKSDAKGNEKR